MDWTQDGLSSSGFSGFTPLESLDPSAVPAEPGVYVVLHATSEPPTFSDVSEAGPFKGKDPTVPVQLLQRAWVPGAVVLYIGKASGGRQGHRGLRRRLDEYRRHGAGEAVGHWGGRHIWQLRDRNQLLVAWKPTPGQDPEEVESELIAAFTKRYGARPFANLKAGRRSPGSAPSNSDGITR